MSAAIERAVEQSVEAAEAALPRVGGAGKWWAADVRGMLTPAAVVVPAVADLAPELSSYDDLLDRSSEAAAVEIATLD